MASRAEAVRRAAAVIAVLILGGFGAWSACEGGQPQMEGGVPPRDALAEQVDAATDASSDMNDACAPTVTPSPDCIHPAVAAQCDGGWCYIPRGCFIMGAPPCEFDRGLYSEDQVQVTFTHDFEMQQTEFTQAQWSTLGYPNPSFQVLDASDGGYTGGNCPDPECPVGNLTLEEVMAAANLLSAKHQPALPECYALGGCDGGVGQGMKCSGHVLTTVTTYVCAGYRLPSEAEWEYAARAGTTTTVYSGEIVPTLLCAPDPNVEKIGWYCYNAKGFTQRVGQKQPNGWGLYDVSCNAAEFTSSQYSGSGYGKGPLVDPMPKLGLSALGLRGGLPNWLAAGCRSAARWFYTNFGFRQLFGGIRLVRTLSWPDGGAPDGGT